ncbi:MAG: glycosyltransferase [Humibacter sp.]
MSSGGVHAVVTAFRPDHVLCEAVTALSGQVDSIIVIDDGSGPAGAEILAEVEALGAQVLRRTQNSGIASVLNAGLEAALSAGADTIVTFDQDSVVKPGFVAALLAERNAARARGRDLGPIVPEYFADVRQVHHRDADGVLVVRHAIQSGMMLERRLLDDVGFFREDLFIDLVDTEFELRCNAAGRAAIAAPGLRLAHSLGRKYERRLFGRRVRIPGIPADVTLSTPFRYYYRVRNRRVVNRTYWRSAFGWILRDSVLEAVHYLNALLLARPRRSLWHLYVTGWRDGGRGRMGRMPDRLRTVAGEIDWDAPEVS